MNKIIRIVIPAVFLSIVLLFGATAVEATHSWGNYHWARTANPFTLKLGNNVTSSWGGYLATTSNAWSKSTVLDTTIVTGLGGRNCKAQTGRVEVCSRTYGNNGWLGLAQIWISGSHITKGVAKMNDTYFNLPQYNNNDEKLHVMCQEVGHTLGLGHTSEDGTSQKTCMDYSNDPESTLPNAHDYDMLEQIYAHTTDTFTTIAATKAAGASALAQSGDFENASEWGRAIRHSSDGKPSLYVRDLAKGEKVFTFVIWADPTAE
jgi:hypothetical protein